MSIALRRPLARAKAELDSFLALLKPEVFCDRWEIAGSLRRGKLDIGDIDIVCMPKFGDVAVEGDLFGQSRRTNLLWHRIDSLLILGTFTKHVRDTVAGPRTCWGDSQRSIEFRGCAYELYTADKDNWGPMLAIRTGPAELGKELVTRLPRYGYACRDGFHIWDTKSSPSRMLPEVTEEQVFKMAGMPYLPPEERE